MKSKLSVVMGVVLMLCVLDVAESWLIHHKHVVHKRVVTIYRCKCRVRCLSHSVCKFNCVRACGGKRDIEEREEGSFDLLLPCRFKAWDLNSDNQIDIKEFAFDAHVDEKDVNTKIAFKKCDADGNGFITREEFKKAPLIKEKC